MENLFPLKGTQEAKALFGTHDENLKLIEKDLGVRIIARGANALKIEGEARPVELARRLFEELILTIRSGGFIKKHELLYAIQTIKKDETVDIHSIYLDRIEVFSKRQFITPKSRGQKEYVDAIRKDDIVFAIGPAGTGKTYLAMAMAVNSLKKQLEPYNTDAARGRGGREFGLSSGGPAGKGHAVFEAALRRAV